MLYHVQIGNYLLCATLPLLEIGGLQSCVALKLQTAQVNVQGAAHTLRGLCYSTSCHFAARLRVCLRFSCSN